MSEKKVNQEALDYHAQGRPGKIEVIPSKPYSSQRDLSLAYSPGVAEPCLQIAANPEDVYKYTAKGNLVAVISNGTAVLGLGNIGPEASKPVMEGKGLLFKIFADIDVFDIEVDETTAGIDQAAGQIIHAQGHVDPAASRGSAGRRAMRASGRWKSKRSTRMEGSRE